MKIRMSTLALITPVLMLFAFKAEANLGGSCEIPMETYHLTQNDWEKEPLKTNLARYSELLRATKKLSVQYLKDIDQAFQAADQFRRQESVRIYDGVYPSGSMAWKNDPVNSVYRIEAFATDDLGFLESKIQFVQNILAVFQAASMASTLEERQDSEATLRKTLDWINFDVFLAPNHQPVQGVNYEFSRDENVFKNVLNQLMALFDGEAKLKVTKILKTLMVDSYEKAAQLHRQQKLDYQALYNSICG